MYEADEKDKVVRLAQVPKPEAGAPMPVILATEDIVALVYYQSVPDYSDL